jgi:antitoxin component YwqK of YwqJK toxin-antitoxin module
MEMDILVHQEISLNNLKHYLLIIGCLFFLSCNEKVEKNGFVLNGENLKLEMSNGIVLYDDVPFSGIIKNFDEVNQTNNSAVYVDGKKNGVEEKRFLNDAIAEQRFYKGGLKSGIHKGWWKNGILKFEYHFDEKGIYNGTVKDWYQNGQLVKEFNYVNGKEKGNQKMWLINGNIKANYTVVNGDRFGLIGLKKCFTVKTNNEK